MLTVCMNYRTDSTSWYMTCYICFREQLSTKLNLLRKHLPKLVLQPQKEMCMQKQENKTMGHITLPLLCGLACDYEPITETL